MGLSLYSAALYSHDPLDNDQYPAGSTSGNSGRFIAGAGRYSVLSQFPEKSGEMSSDLSADLR